MWAASRFVFYLSDAAQSIVIQNNSEIILERYLVYLIVSGGSSRISI